MWISTVFSDSFLSFNSLKNLINSRRHLQFNFEGELMTEDLILATMPMIPKYEVEDVAALPPPRQDAIRPFASTHWARAAGSAETQVRTVLVPTFARSRAGAQGDRDQLQPPTAYGTGLCAVPKLERCARTLPRRGWKAQETYLAFRRSGCSYRSIISPAPSFC